jgi:hypothetical protein
MTIDEKVLACAKSNGFSYNINEVEIVRPRYKFRNNSCYEESSGGWDIYNYEKGQLFSVTDEQFKRWERDFKINEILNK